MSCAKSGLWVHAIFNRIDEGNHVGCGPKIFSVGRSWPRIGEIINYVN